MQQALKEVGINSKFSAPFFHEIVISLKLPVAKVQDKLAAKGIQAGFDLSKYYPELGNALLCCTTEVKTLAQIKNFAQELANANL